MGDGQSSGNKYCEYVPVGDTEQTVVGWYLKSSIINRIGGLRKKMKRKKKLLDEENANKGIREQ